ncbi:phosphate ABC transporter permease PstA [Zavarzinia sp. CC-PAN008]|uniref:phosphate ABC transporter permease PstA n=1 Tax=Zavarzinia sp. CC-PAN008 TaxID=3243332 RepID=UPI003F743AA7
MTDSALGSSTSAGRPVRSASDLVAASLKRRYAAERRFRLYGLVAISVAVLFLVTLLGSILIKGTPAFFQSRIGLDITFSADVIDPTGARDPVQMNQADYGKLIRAALDTEFPEVTERRERRALGQLLSAAAPYELAAMVRNDPALIGQTQRVWFVASDMIDMVRKGSIDRTTAEGDRPVKDRELAWMDKLEAQGRIETVFNLDFFTSADSVEPELAGIWGALSGSFFMLVVTLFLSFPIAVMAAIYLEEFAPKNRWTDLIEVNINNLAAVPSIVFGLLGAAVFLNFFDMPRGAPIVGGIVMALLVLPTMIVAGRVALKAVPPSIREAALGIGASPVQVATHHVLPLAMPGMLTGTILAMAHALGETAPLLMIGMVAFITAAPEGFTDAATALPVQIFLWADKPERAFIEKTSGAIIVLLAFLVVMNLLAVLLRRRLERRW